jgi:glycosyltransferase involved in cell wall biosynthesis
MVENISDSYNIGRCQITPIHHGYNPATFYKVPSQEVEATISDFDIVSPYIIHVSNFRKVKNTENILRGFTNWKQGRDDSTSLVFVGPHANNYTKILRLSEELGVADDVRFTGHVPSEDLKYLYAGAEFLCQPSYRETFSFPILESLACGTPVVTSNDVGVLEQVPEGQIRVDPTSVDEITDAFETVVGNEKKQTELIKQVQHLVEIHKWKNIIPKYIDLYESELEP